MESCDERGGEIHSRGFSASSLQILINRDRARRISSNCLSKVAVFFLASAAERITAILVKASTVIEVKSSSSRQDRLEA